MRRLALPAAVLALSAGLAGLAGCGSKNGTEADGPGAAASATPSAPATAGATGDAGTGSAGSTAAASSASASPASPADKEAALRRAIEGYTNALFRANAAGMNGYLDESCSPSDLATAVYSAREVKEIADGATIRVTGVAVHGDRGEMTTYELSAGAPDALRRMMKAAQDAAERDPWRYTDGEWYFTGICGTTPGLVAPVEGTERPVPPPTASPSPKG